MCSSKTATTGCCNTTGAGLSDERNEEQSSVSEDVGEVYVVTDLPIVLLLVGPPVVSIMASSSLSQSISLQSTINPSASQCAFVFALAFLTWKWSS